LGTDDGKRGFLARACEIMAGMRLRETTLDIYAGRLAEELGVNREAITHETERRRGIIRRQGEKKQQGFLPTNLAPIYGREGAVPVQQRRAEETLLASLMSAPELYAKLADELPPELFPSADCRRAAELLIARLAAGAEVEPAFFEQEAAPDEMALFTQLAMQRKGVGASLKECRDCLEVLHCARDKPPDDITALSDDEWLKLITGKGT
ncbi:MAG: hypothetical protein LBT21_04810, partial [Oscillospiraceae bacterium]|nr:hypothetical protein [Oscillospiraceae bacterium]